MSTAPKRSTTERLAGRAALGALRVIEAAMVAAGYAAKGLLKIAGPGKAVRELREREAGQARQRQEDAHGTALGESWPHEPGDNR